MLFSACILCKVCLHSIIDKGKRDWKRSTLEVQSVFPCSLIETVFYTKNSTCCKTRTSTLVSVRAISAVRGAVLMVYIHDLWMQVRVKPQRPKLLSCVLDEFQREPCHNRNLGKEM